MPRSGAGAVYIYIYIYMIGLETRAGSLCCSWTCVSCVSCGVLLGVPCMWGAGLVTSFVLYVAECIVDPFLYYVSLPTWLSM